MSPSPQNLREYLLVLGTVKPESLLTVEATINLIKVIEKELESLRREILISELKVIDKS